MEPIPCGHCGTLFMRRDLALDAPKLCNSCDYKEAQRQKQFKKQGEPMMKILIECDPVIHAKIEEICMNEGISYSEYFLNMHKDKMFKYAESFPDKGTFINHETANGSEKSEGRPESNDCNDSQNVESEDYERPLKKTMSGRKK